MNTRLLGVHQLVLEHPQPKGKVYPYGTSGFRDRANVLSAICLRMGFLAALRSISLARNKVCPVVGLVVTASHNEEQDNGVKVVDHDGGMLDSRWEGIATRLAGADNEKVTHIIQEIAKAEGVDWALTPHVFVGSDTRPSSPFLIDIVKKGLGALETKVRDYGFITTPQLHWLVGQANRGRKHEMSDYYLQMSTAFLTLMPKADGYYVNSLLLDCANGSGKVAINEFIPLIKHKLQITMINTDHKGINHQSGAEHVQKTKTIPRHVDPKRDCGKKCASLDGDADRLVYFYLPDDKTPLRVLDGDKISALATSFLMNLLQDSKLQHILTMGVIQTAYANGASTRWLQEMKVIVEFGKTGVKHIHRMAEKYDVGIYFEANGHGTILFSERALESIHTAMKSTEETIRQAALQLFSLTQLMNPYIGDAISDMLFVEAVLSLKKWKLSHWDTLYKDHPSCSINIKVQDRTLIQTTETERACVTPPGMQTKIDQVVDLKRSDVRRAFVRPSGTEDVVRIYAEADSQHEAEELASQVKQVVSDTLEF